MVILWMMILPLLRPGAYNLYFFLLGAPVSLHLMSAITDFISQSRIREGTDIHIVGFGFSLIIVVFMNILIYGTVLATVLGGAGQGRKILWCLVRGRSGGRRGFFGCWFEKLRVVSWPKKCQMTLFGPGETRRH